MAALNALVSSSSSADALSLSLDKKVTYFIVKTKQVKRNSKKAEAKTVTPVDGVNKTIFSIWHRGWIGDLFGAIYFGAPSFMHLSS